MDLVAIIIGEIIAVGVDAIGVVIITIIITVIIIMAIIIMAIITIIAAITLAGANWFIARNSTLGCGIVVIKNIRCEWIHKAGVVPNFSEYESEIEAPRLSSNHC